MVATQVVKFGQFAGIGPVEDALEESFAGFPDGFDQGSVCLDFSRSRFFDLPTLQYLIAMIRSRNLRGLTTQMRLPTGASGLAARHFLRRWEFPAAVSKACNMPFSRLVVEEDHRYFKGRGGDPSDAYPGVTTTYRFPGGEITLRQEVYRFFGFSTWFLSHYRHPNRLVREATSSWAGQPIKAVLDRHLRVESDSDSEDTRGTVAASRYVRGRVFYEAITNAVRHPGASLIQAASHLSEPEGTDKKFFTLVFWDDGESMLGTLSRALRDGVNIRENYYADFDTEYRIRVFDEAGTPAGGVVVDSRTSPTMASQPWEILLGTIFPGTTCDPEGRNHSVDADLRRDDPRRTLPGMGLFVLVDVAARELGGSVAFRTADWFMNVRSAPRREVGFKVKLQRRGGLPSFLGNMVTVRLPLRDQSS